jgi:hypothetical protein
MKRQIRKITFSLILIAISSIISKETHAQILEYRITEFTVDEMSVGAGPALFSFMGDIGGPEKYADMYQVIRPGLLIYTESKITHSLASSWVFELANLQSFDRNRNRNLAFKTKAFHGAWNIHYYFDNNQIMKSNRKTSPYISLGLGVIAFHPEDMDGNILDTDMDYEKTALTLPFSMGFKYKLNHRFQMRLNAGITLTSTDFIDNYSRQANQPVFISSHKDAFMSTSLSMHYIFSNETRGLSISRFPCMERYFTAGWGFIHYSGEIASNFNLKSNAFQFGIEQRFSNHLGASVNGMFGLLTVRDTDPTYFTSNRHFQTTLVHGSISALYYFDNELMISRNANISPFLIAGAGYLAFNPRKDMKDIAERPYFFWDDGRIMNQPEGTPDARELIADNIYETNPDPERLSPKSALTLQAGGGLNLKFTKSISVRLHSNYIFTNTGHLDMISSQATNSKQIFSKKNDRLWLNSFTLLIDLRSSACRRAAPLVD